MTEEEDGKGGRGMWKHRHEGKESTLTLDSQFHYDYSVYQLEECYVLLVERRVDGG